MPIYEYRCSACGHQKEYLQRITDAPLTDCPECGKGALVKLVTAAGFQLKGTGWYATDFRNNGSKPAKDDKAGEKPTASGEGATKEKETAKTDTACGSGACPACS